MTSTFLKYLIHVAVALTGITTILIAVGSALLTVVIFFVLVSASVVGLVSAAALGAVCVAVLGLTGTFGIALVGAAGLHLINSTGFGQISLEVGQTMPLFVDVEETVSYVVEDNFGNHQCHCGHHVSL